MFHLEKRKEKVMMMSLRELEGQMVTVKELSDAPLIGSIVVNFPEKSLNQVRLT